MTGSSETNNLSPQPVTPRPAEPASAHELALERVLAAREAELPEDTPTPLAEQFLALKQPEPVDSTLAKQVTRYPAQERREKLDQQIERLYDRLIQESNNNWQETGPAFDQLRKAHNLTLEDKRQYNEALYIIAAIEERLIYKHNLQRWSQTWGLFILVYALIWLILLAAAFFIDLEAWVGPALTSYQFLTTAWYAALAGGIGGTIAILHHFSKIVSKNEFDRQDVMRYLVQPVIGFIVGALIFFMVSSGLFLINNPFGGAGEALNLSQVVLILLGGLAGFGQEFVYQGIEEIINRVTKNRVASAQAALEEDELP